jgi:hypothetical protein
LEGHALVFTFIEITLSSMKIPCQAKRRKELFITITIDHYPIFLLHSWFLLIGAYFPLPLLPGLVLLNFFRSFLLFTSIGGGWLS